MTQDQWDALLDREPMNEELRHGYYDWLLEQGRDREAHTQRYILDGKAWVCKDIRCPMPSDYLWDLFLVEKHVAGCFSSILFYRLFIPESDLKQWQRQEPDYYHHSRMRAGITRFSFSCRSSLESALCEALHR